MRRVSVVVPADRAEEARATMLGLFSEGFEEVERPGALELAAYTDRAGAAVLADAFEGVTATPVAPDWAYRWRAFHRPTRVGEIWVGPPWENAPLDAIAVVVDPGRAFGTGAHATTRLCLGLLQGLPRRGLLDVGCGSGVLAIAAAKLGFAPVLAVDVDDAAVAATEANARANSVALDVWHADALAVSLPEADLAVANIELRAVEQVAARLRTRLTITSGYYAADRPVLPRYRWAERRSEAGWAADLFVRQ